MSPNSYPRQLLRVVSLIVVGIVVATGLAYGAVQFILLHTANADLRAELDQRDDRINELVELRSGDSRRLERLSRQVRSLTDQVAALSEQVRQLGGVPVTEAGATGASGTTPGISSSGQAAPSSSPPPASGNRPDGPTGGGSTGGSDPPTPVPDAPSGDVNIEVPCVTALVVQIGC